MSNDGIQVDPKKIETVIDWPRPTTITKVINFLGLTDYYERFVEDFPKIATPLARLTHKNIKFNWTDKCKEHLQLLTDC